LHVEKVLHFKQVTQLAQCKDYTLKRKHTSSMAYACHNTSKLEHL